MAFAPLDTPMVCTVAHVFHQNCNLACNALRLAFKSNTAVSSSWIYWLNTCMWHKISEKCQQNQNTISVFQNKEQFNILFLSHSKIPIFYHETTKVQTAVICLAVLLYWVNNAKNDAILNHHIHLTVNNITLFDIWHLS